MHHFFVASQQVNGQEIRITGADVNHISNVLRMKPGEELTISDGESRRYHCRLKELNKDCVLTEIITADLPETELASNIYLFQGLPKADKMELIVQKSVELGVFEIIPVASGRSVVKLDAKKAQKKGERWQMIAESGAKQSGRSRIPKVMPVMSYREALAYAKQLDVVLIPYELADGMNETRERIAAIKKGQSVGIFIGPEGGFEASEIEAATQLGMYPVTLGRRILRTETAGLAMLSILMYHLES